jgi:hypothetical protein
VSDERSVPAAGAGISWGDLAVLAVWGAAGVVLAMRFFRWSPKR